MYQAEGVSFSGYLASIGPSSAFPALRAPSPTWHAGRQCPIQRRSVSAGLSAGNDFDGLHPSLVNNKLSLAQRALHLIIVCRDFDKAREQLAIAARGLPNNAYVFWFRAGVNFGQWRWEEAIRDYEQAVILEPRYPKVLLDLAATYLALRRFRQAEQTTDRLIALKPDEPALMIFKAYIVFGEKADLKKYLTIVGTVPASSEEREDIAWSRFQAALFARDWSKAREILSHSVNEQFGTPYGAADLPRECWEIWLSRLQRDNPAMEPRFAAARDQLNRKVDQNPGYAELLSALGIIDAAMGHKQEAIQEAERAVEMAPISKDPEIGAPLVTNLAIVYGWLNETELAFRELTISVKTPGGVLYGELAFDPDWDPRFDKLLAELAPRD